MPESYESIYARLKDKYIKDPETATEEDFARLEQATEEEYSQQKINEAAAKEQERFDKPGLLERAHDKLKRLLHGKNKEQQAQMARATMEQNNGK